MEFACYAQNHVSLGSGNVLPLLDGMPITVGYTVLSIKINLRYDGGK